MEYRQLGDSGMRVSTMGLGCFAFAGDKSSGSHLGQEMTALHAQVWGPQDDADTFACIRRALQLGVNFFDTAEMYGDGYSEDVLGRALASCADDYPRSSYFIATKVSETHLNAAGLRSALRASLARLRSTYIDLYQIHWHSRAAVRSEKYRERPLEKEVELEETLHALRQLQEEGLIRHIGVCNFGPEDLQKVINSGVRIVSNQICYNLLWRCSELSGLMRLCQDNRISVIAWSPLQQGLLTAKFACADDVPSGRARTRLFSRRRPFQRHDEEGQEAEAFAAIAALKVAVAEHNASTAQAASAADAAADAVSCEGDVTLATASIAWVLHHPAVACALVGCRDAPQVECNVASATWRMPSHMHERFGRITLPLAHKLGTANLDPYEGASHSRIR